MPRRAVEPEDILKLRMVSDPQIQPCGRTVVYRVIEADCKEDGYQSSLWGISTEGGEPRRLTWVGKANMSARWSPDGKSIAFISDRSGTPQVWVMPFEDGGDSYQVTRNLEGVGTPPVWRPDGKALAVLALGAAKPGDPVPKTPEIKAVSDIWYKMDGAGVFGPAKQHVYVVSLPGGEATQVTEGAFHHGLPSWSPDGSRLALTSSRRPDADVSTLAGLYILDPATREHRLVLDGFTGFSLPAPVWSPDGKRVLVMSGREPVFRHHTAGIWSVDVSTAACVNLMAGLDRPPMPVDGGDIVTFDPRVSPEWSRDGKYVYTPVGDAGASELFRIDTAAGGLERVTKGSCRNVMGFSVACDGSVAFTVTDASCPGELFYLGLAGEEKQLTSVNVEYFKDTGVYPTEAFTYQSIDGLEIQGWLVRPEGDGPHPLVLDIHGGPHGAYGFAFHHKYQSFAARGYAVLYTNPRGSQSYGTEFARACIRDWGGLDYQDIMVAVDLMIERKVADPSRLFVTGYSYGGFMTNWIITHSARFRAAVAGGCVSNLYSFFGSSDIGPHFMMEEIGGPHWETLEPLMKHSPLSHVAAVTTPTLFLHGERDDRCPIDQSEQMYVALKVMGKTTQLVRYPGSSHLFILTGKPSYRIDYIKRSLDWFDKYGQV